MSTLAQQKAVAIVPKCTAAASILGSATIIFLLAFREDKHTTYHRLVLGMSLCDILASIAHFCTTWPIPRGTPGVYGAVGNQQSCSAQGFFTQMMTLSTVWYNASLAIYYVMVIVKNKRYADIVRVEPLLHINAIAWGLGTSVASLALTLFNEVGWECWISAHPLGCRESWSLEEGEVTTCTRGDNGSLYQWAFYFIPLWFVIVLISGLMYWVYASVRNRENAMKKYAGSMAASPTGPSSSSAAHLAQHKRVARQAFYYIGAFYFTWFFPTVFRIVTTTGQFPFWLLLLTALFLPIQGTLNLIVFVRPQYIKYRQRHPDSWAISAWFHMLYLKVSGKPDDKDFTLGSIKSYFMKKTSNDGASAVIEEDAFEENPKTMDEETQEEMKIEEHDENNEANSNQWILKAKEEET